MHPAYSVIFFTTASGAGYGLLTWLALASALRGIPPDWRLGFVGLGLALLLVTGGLLSSTAHLGRPERAWRAFSQWRTSWLSREGVLAVATYVPVAILGIAWVFYGKTDGAIVFASLVAAALAMTTVYATGMIYASLPTIRAWNQPLTTPIYIALSLASGGILFVFLLSFMGPLPRWSIVLVLVALAVAGVMKFAYWRTVDETPRTLRPGHATGLGKLGRVRQLEPPHAQANFVMREMGYTVGRRHASKLRRIAVVATFIVPAVCLALCFAAVALQPVLAFVAVLAAAVGLFVERWLFFAEAEHVVMLYYGAEAA